MGRNGLASKADLILFPPIGNGLHDNLVVVPLLEIIRKGAPDMG